MTRSALVLTVFVSGCFGTPPPRASAESHSADGTPVLPGDGDDDTTSEGTTSDASTSAADSSGPTGDSDPGPRCGDGIPDPGEACDDGNDEPGDGCDPDCEAEVHACAKGVKTVGEDVELGIGVCKDNAGSTCEQDFASLCAPGWHLCSGAEHVLLNDGVVIDLGESSALGVIRCRTQGGSGHYTSHDFNVDGPDSCEMGSSRVDCPTNLGCNEGMHAALCCAPIPSCGNGQVDDPREECDDGNADDLDGCSNACANRFGTGPHC